MTGSACSSGAAGRRSAATAALLLMGCCCLAAATAASPPGPASSSNDYSPHEQQLQQCYDISYNNLARSNDVFDSNHYGRLIDIKGQPIVRPVPSDDSFTQLLSPAEQQQLQDSRWRDGARLAYVHSNDPDFPSVHEVGGKVFLINHFEAPQPSTAYVSELTQDADTKQLRMVETAPVDASGVSGLWFMCRGEKTPWGTHMGSEEYPPDCRSYEEVFLPCKEGADLCGYNATSDGKGIIAFARFYGFYNDAQDFDQQQAAFGTNPGNLADFKQRFSCYNYGSSPEISVIGADGATSIIKWRTIGRISHETELFMPDQRTVYTTDDGSNGVLLKFVMDRAGDLSSGSLYAAEFKNKPGTAEEFYMNWVLLGRGNQAELDALAAKPSTTFSMLFDAVNVTKEGKCPDGFYPSPNPLHPQKVGEGGKLLYVECLRIKPGMETYAAFFESRRVAAIKGATTELEKMEGITLDNDRKKLYIAITSVDKGMLEQSKYDGLGPDHLRFKQNLCGMVLQLDLDEQYVATDARILLAGSNATGTDPKNKCDINNIASPDNLFYHSGNLFIAEDTPYHLNNVLWAFNLKTGSLTRILSSPKGAEVTGIALSYVGADAYITLAMQHPMELDEGKFPANEQEASDTRGYVGYIGPLPVAAVAREAALDFSPGGIQPARSEEEQKAVLAASKACVTFD